LPKFRLNLTKFAQIKKKKLSEDAAAFLAPTALDTIKNHITVHYIISKSIKIINFNLGVKYFFKLIATVLIPGFCKKLSGGKNILEDRYLKLTADGIISWFEKEDDTRSKGSIQVRGEQVNLDADDRRTLYVHTKGRRYHFAFVDEHESNLWLTSMSWHTCRQPLDGIMRNPKK